jgi:hypothetical protein
VSNHAGNWRTLICSGIVQASSMARLKKSGWRNSVGVTSAKARSAVLTVSVSAGSTLISSFGVISLI